jgi:glycosyltransferase involved in cell wall biosynthesis
MHKSEKSPLISIIIPTKNEERNLGKCLGSILNSSYKNVEIVVVDQNSSDTTKQIARKFGATVINVEATDKYIPPSNSRNIGFKASKGDYIYHIDADMELKSNLLEEIVSLFRDTTISAIIVPENDISANIWAKAKAFERALYHNTEMEAARVSRREVFAKILYDTSIQSGEDWNIHNEFKKEGRIVRTQETVNHYLGNISLKKEFIKKSQYGTGATHYVKKNRLQLATTFAKLCILYFAAILKGLTKDPRIVIAFIIIRTTDSMALMYGLVSSKVAVVNKT